MVFNKKTRALYIIMSLFMLVGCGVSKPKEESSGAGIHNAAEPYSDHSDGIEKTVSDDELWEEAVSLIEKRKYPQAISVLSRIEENDRADDLLQQLRYIISGDYIQNLLEGVAAIDNEGKVIIRINDDGIYKANGYASVQDWTDIKRLSYVFHGLDALSSEGAFFTTLDDEEFRQRHDERFSEEFRRRNEQLGKISGISIFATGDSNYAVTDQSGKLYLYNEFSDYLETEWAQKEIESWSDIVDIVTGDLRVAVLHKDGTVGFVYSNKSPNQVSKSSVFFDDMKEWTDIVDISGSDIGSIAGLRADGTVLVSHRMLGEIPGEYYMEVSKWTDIIAISKSSRNILGLKSDGTVVTAGLVNEGQKEVAEWTDIVAVSAGQNFHVGLKSDGTLVVAGEREGNKPLPDVSDVKNLYVPKISYEQPESGD